MNSIDKKHSGKTEIGFTAVQLVEKVVFDKL